jgi:hypothetical protein
MLTLVSPSAVWKTQRAPASIAGAAQVRRLVGDSCMCRDDFHRAQERFQDVCASKRPPTTHCCFCSMRQRGYAVIDSSPRCSHSSEGAARHRMPVRRRDFSFRQRAAVSTCAPAVRPERAWAALQAGALVSRISTSPNPHGFETVVGVTSTRRFESLPSAPTRHPPRHLESVDDSLRRGIGARRSLHASPG